MLNKLPLKPEKLPPSEDWPEPPVFMLAKGLLAAPEPPNPKLNDDDPLAWPNANGDEPF
jgi:hypothetical protein